MRYRSFLSLLERTVRDPRLFWKLAALVVRFREHYAQIRSYEISPPSRLCTLSGLKLQIRPAGEPDVSGRAGSPSLSAA